MSLLPISMIDLEPFESLFPVVDALSNAVISAEERHERNVRINLRLKNREFFNLGCLFTTTMAKKDALVEENIRLRHHIENIKIAQKADWEATREYTATKFKDVSIQLKAYAVKLWGAYDELSVQISTVLVGGEQYQTMRGKMEALWQTKGATGCLSNFMNFFCSRADSLFETHLKEQEKIRYNTLIEDLEIPSSDVASESLLIRNPSTFDPLEIDDPFDGVDILQSQIEQLKQLSVSIESENTQLKDRIKVLTNRHSDLIEFFKNKINELILHNVKVFEGHINLTLKCAYHTSKDYTIPCTYYTMRDQGNYAVQKMENGDFRYHYMENFGPTSEITSSTFKMQLKWAATEYFQLIAQIKEESFIICSKIKALT